MRRCLNRNSMEVRLRLAEKNSEGMIGLEGPGRLALISATRAEDIPKGDASLASRGAPNPRRLEMHGKDQRMIVGVVAMAFMVGGLGGLVYRGGWGRR